MSYAVAHMDKNTAPSVFAKYADDVRKKTYITRLVYHDELDKFALDKVAPTPEIAVRRFLKI